MRQLAGLAAGLLLAQACATGPMGEAVPEASRFAKEWDRYRTLEDARALALAGQVDGLFVIGYAHGLESEDEAVAQARTECEIRRALRGLEAPCRIHAIGDRIVDAGSPAAP